MSLLKQPTIVFGKSGLWGSSLRIFEFEHEGPSRSGTVTISVVLSGDDIRGENLYLIAVAHHEGLCSYYPDEWQQMINETLLKLHEAKVDSYEKEDAENLVAIDRIVKDLIITK